MEQCDTCQKNKTKSTQLASLLQPILLPECILEVWSMDFMEGLTMAMGVNVFMVVVDRLSKYAYFIT